MTLRLNQHLILLLLFGTLFALYSSGPRFPVYWNPDELAKAEQLLGTPPNFYHPQLLLRLAQVCKAALRFSDDTRGTVLAGRLASGFCAALAATFAAALVTRRYGILYGLATGVLVGLSPILYVNAQFFKEDTMLLMGIAATLLAMEAVTRQPSWLNLSALGITAGLAFAAKYIGIIMIAPVVTILIVTRVECRRIALCLATSVTTFILINLPALQNFHLMRDGLASEFDHVTTRGHGGIAWGWHSPRLLIDLWHNLPVAFLLLWLGGIVVLAIQKKRSIFDWILMVLPLLIFSVLQISKIKGPRYLLPVVSIALIAAIWNCAEIQRAIRSAMLRWMALVLVGIGFVGTLWGFATALTAHFNDNRFQVVTWLRSHIPADASIASDFYAGLPAESMQSLDSSIPTLPQRLAAPRFYVADYGSLADLRSASVTHIVVSSANYGRFFDSTADLFGAQALHRKAFYADLFARFEPVLVLPATTHVDPVFCVELRVYDIRPDHTR